MVSSINKFPDNQSFLLDHVAFYGRTLNEYIDMFQLRAEDWHGKRILDCASGSSSFASEAHRIGINSVACDPLYAHNLQKLLPLAESDLEKCAVKSATHRQFFDPSACDIESHYGAEKQRALFNFSRDYTQGKGEGRYVVGALPQLPFASNNFDLVLCAHFLFVYATKESGGMFAADHYDESFHISAIRELIRVARNEVRIYPLKGPNRPDSPILNKVLSVLKREPLQIDLVEVDYRDIAGANMMLRIRKQKV